MIYIHKETGETVEVVKKSMSHIEFVDNKQDWYSFPILDFEAQYLPKEQTNEIR